MASCRWLTAATNCCFRRGGRQLPVARTRQPGVDMASRLVEQRNCGARTPSRAGPQGRQQQVADVTLLHPSRPAGSRPAEVTSPHVAFCVKSLSRLLTIVGNISFDDLEKILTQILFLKLVFFSPNYWICCCCCFMRRWVQVRSSEAGGRREKKRKRRLNVHTDILLTEQTFVCV